MNTKKHFWSYWWGKKMKTKKFTQEDLTYHDLEIIIKRLKREIKKLEREMISKRLENDETELLAKVLELTVQIKEMIKNRSLGREVWRLESKIQQLEKNNEKYIELINMIDWKKVPKKKLKSLKKSLIP